MIQIQSETTTKNNILRSIAVCSAQPVLVAGLRAIVSFIEGFEVASEWQSLSDVMAAPPVEKPHLLLIETTPDVSLDTLQAIANVTRGVSLVLWVEGISLEFVHQALNMGVRGVLRKNSTIAQ